MIAHALFPLVLMGGRSLFLTAVADIWGYLKSFYPPAKPEKTVGGNMEFVSRNQESRDSTRAIFPPYLGRKSIYAGKSAVNWRRRRITSGDGCYREMCLAVGFGKRYFQFRQGECQLMAVIRKIYGYFRLFQRRDVIQNWESILRKCGISI